MKLREEKAIEITPQLAYKFYNIGEKSICYKWAVSKSGRHPNLGKTIPYSYKAWPGPAKLGNMLGRTCCKND